MNEGCDAMTALVAAAPGPTTRSFYSFFDEPHFGYNVLNLSVAALGVGLGLWALWLAYNQLRRTLDAAEAARKASEETAAGMRRITLLVNAVQLSGFCGQLLHLLRDQNLSAAALRIHDLRIGVVELSASPSGPRLQTEDWWQTMLTAIVLVQEIVEKAITTRSQMSERARRRCMESMTQIDADLRSLVSKAAHGTGG